MNFTCDLQVVYMFPRTALRREHRIVGARRISTTSIIRQTDIIDRTKLFEPPLPCAVPPFSSFSFSSSSNTCRPFSSATQTLLGCAGRAIQLWLRLSLRLSFSTRDVGVSSIRYWEGGRAGRDVRCRAGATAAPVLIRSVSPAAEDF